MDLAKRLGNRFLKSKYGKLWATWRGLNLWP